VYVDLGGMGDEEVVTLPNVDSISIVKLFDFLNKYTFDAPEVLQPTLRVKKNIVCPMSV
jgi:hypothetical protein